MNISRSDTTSPTAEQTARLRLSDKHLTDLRNSGLTYDTIAAMGCWTEHDPTKINTLLNRRDGHRLGPSLCIPYDFVPNGTTYVRIKPDQPPTSLINPKGAKYLAPRKQPFRIYFSPSFHQQITSTEQHILISEGEKKTLAIWQLGHPAIGLPGVECWSSPRPKDQFGKKIGPRTLSTELQAIAWKNRIVFIAFDSDVVVKRGVSAAEKALASALTQAGATVMLIRIPHPQDGNKLGIDDYLAIQSNARETLDQMLAAATPFVSPTTSVGPYCVHDNSLVYEKMTRDGLTYTPLTNFTANITEEILFDDGISQRREYAIEGRNKDGVKLPQVIVDAEEFVSMNWPLAKWGASTTVYAGFGNKDHARCAIQLLSKPVEKTVYTHLGWRKLNGGWHYLHAGGAITAQGFQTNVSCQPPLPLRSYDFPKSPNGDDLVRAIRASLSLVMAELPDRITFPLLAAIYRAPLGSCDFAVYLAGFTGVFKSEWAALAQQHFGVTMDARHLPANWASTGNALEGLAFAAKDALLVMDDFAPSGSATDIQRLHREAERIFRAQGNNAGRLRMQADTSLRQERPPRGLILSTGEDIPKAHSIRARLLVIEIQRGDITSGALSALQQHATEGRFASAMSGYLQDLAGQFDLISSEIGTQRRFLRDEFVTNGNHARTPTAVADLALGLHFFLKFATKAGAINQVERVELWKRGRLALLQLSIAQSEHHEAANPVDRFISLIQSALANGRAHLADTAGQCPATNAHVLGWRAIPQSMNARQPSGTLIGWVAPDDKLIYLDLNSAYSVVQQFESTQGNPFSLTATMLVRHFYERGLLERICNTGNKRRYKIRVQLAGLRREVLCMKLATILPDFGAPSAPFDERPDESAAESENTTTNTVDHHGYATQDMRQKASQQSPEATPAPTELSSKSNWSKWQ